jgi:hypothetical protein
MNCLELKSASGSRVCIICRCLLIIQSSPGIFHLSPDVKKSVEGWDVSVSMSIYKTKKRETKPNLKFYHSVALLQKSKQFPSKKTMSFYVFLSLRHKGCCPVTRAGNRLCPCMSPLCLCGILISQPVSLDFRKLI